MLVRRNILDGGARTSCCCFWFQSLWDGISPEVIPVAPATGISAACEPELRLIFKDGHTEAIRNYVPTPHDVIAMDAAASGQVPRIALSELNLPAPEQAARKDGVDFSPPAT